jgi:hypothetical protein
MAIVSPPREALCYGLSGAPRPIYPGDSRECGWSVPVQTIVRFEQLRIWKGNPMNNLILRPVITREQCIERKDIWVVCVPSLGGEAQMSVVESIRLEGKESPQINHYIMPMNFTEVGIRYCTPVLLWILVEIQLPWNKVILLMKKLETCWFYLIKEGAWS